MVFKLKADKLTQVRIGVQVRDDSPRDTLEVPVVFSHGGRSENRTYTFVKFTRTRNERSVIQTRSTRFLECPQEVAELLAGVEFQVRDPLSVGGVKRGQWLDVRLATNQREYDRADEIEAKAVKAEVEPEPPNLLRKQRVTRTGPAATVLPTLKPEDADTLTEYRAKLEGMTRAQLEGECAHLSVPIAAKATKAQIMDALVAHEQAKAEG